ncbi:MAG: hypothetical protein OEX14_10260 [Paracoccaceae bacterium]|nr:hypothetical protein [Paracoccaceae bacterium]
MSFHAVPANNASWYGTLLDRQTKADKTATCCFAICHRFGNETEYLDT